MNTKDIIINSARELFKKYGYKKVSMDEIAKDAKVTKRTVYSYFKDKESLFEYFIDEDLEIVKEKIEKLEKEKLPFIKRISKILFYALNFKEQNALFKAISNDKDLSLLTRLKKRYDDIILNFIEGKINKEITEGTIKNCNSKLMAFIIYNIYLSVMFIYEDKLNEEEIVNEITLILKDGLLN